MGVEIFFVLSGFIIAYSYFESKWTVNGIRTFYIKRVSRIYPLYLLITIMTYTVFFLLRDPHSNIRTFLYNLFLVKGFSADYYLTPVTAAWSLTTEMTFYALFPLIVWAFAKKIPGIVQVIVFYLAGVIAWLVFRWMPFDGLFDTLNFTAFVTFFGRCAEFYFGIYLCRLFRSGKISGIQPASIAKNRKWPFRTHLGLAGMALLALGMAVYAHLGQFNPARRFEGIFVYNIIFPLFIIIFLAGLLSEQGWIRSFFGNRWMVLLGKSSYAFFLLHTGVVAIALEKYISTNPWVLFFALEAISILVYLWIERPLNKRTRKFLLKTLTRQDPKGHIPVPEGS